MQNVGGVGFKEREQKEIKDFRHKIFLTKAYEPHFIRMSPIGCRLEVERGSFEKGEREQKEVKFSKV